MVASIGAKRPGSGEAFQATNRLQSCDSPGRALKMSASDPAVPGSWRVASSYYLAEKLVPFLLPGGNYQLDAVE